MFSTLYGSYFSFQMHFNISSASCFNFDQSKILSSGNGLSTIQTNCCNICFGTNRHLYIFLVDKNNEDIETTSIPLYDNDLAYEIQIGSTSGDTGVTSWFDIPTESNNDNFHNIFEDEENGNENNSPSVVSWADIPKNKKSANDSKIEADKKGGSFLSLNSLDDKGIQKQLDREKTRKKEKELATNILSPRGPLLSTQALDNIDLGTDF